MKEKYLPTHIGRRNERKHYTYMHKIISFLLILTLAAFTVSHFTKEKALASGSVWMNENTLSLEVDHYRTLRIYGTSSSASWYSSNNSIAYVTSYGRVYAKSAGTATITAYVSGKKLTCKVNVIYMKKSVTLTPGETYQLTTYGSKQNPDFLTDSEAVATVSDTGTVTAKAPGTAVITAYVDGKYITSKISVIGLDNEDIVLELGGWSGFIKTLKMKGYDGNISWFSSNNKIAVVSSSGRVRAKGYGEATITAYADRIKLTCKVKVLKIDSNEFTLKKGETKRLKIYGTSDEVTWTSNKKSVAIVSKDGTVSTVAAGKAIIFGYVDGRRVMSTVTVID